MPTKVVNIKYEKCDIYIGRSKKKFNWGNPFIIGLHGNRNKVCNMFKLWIEETDYKHIEPERRKWIIKNISKLHNNILGCFCKPKRCHGDYLAFKAEEICQLKGGE